MEKEIKIKVGDKVLLKNKRGENWNSNGEMDKYMGKIVTVSKFSCFYGGFYIEETDKWIFEINDIERIIYDEFKRDDLQFADIVTTRNGERYVYADDRIYGESDDYVRDFDYISTMYDENLKFDVNSEYDIMKVERAGQVIWERSEKVKEVKEMTLAEISEALGYEVKVVKETKDKICAWEKINE